MTGISFLEQLLGTRTKIRIMKILINEGSPLSRNRLAGLTGTGTGSVYEQVDQLIALGALKEENGKVSMDQDFPYLEALRDLILITEDHMDDPQTILRSVDRILGMDYYITGFVSACQNGMPIDVEENTILLMVKEPDTRKERMLGAISECSESLLRWQSTNWIPKDVQRSSIFGAEVWISSVERGMVDSIKAKECGYYPIFLLLVQNIVNGSVDLQRLMEYANDQGTGNIFGSALSIISDRLPTLYHPVNFQGPPDQDVVRSVNMALNTVLG